MSEETTGMRSWAGTVEPLWIDANGHMSEGWFGVAFAMATDELLVRIGADPAHRDRTGGAFYTVETHIAFLAEVDPGAELAIDSVVIGVDLLRLHLFHRMLASALGSGEPTLVATQESLLFHVDAVTDRVGPMPAPAFEAASELADAHHDAVERDLLGRAIVGP